MHYSPTLLLLIALSIFCSSGAQVCQKLAAQNHTNHSPLVVNPHFIASLILLTTGLISWLLVLARMDVSTAYPLLSLNFLFVQLTAKFYFGETIPAHRWLGTVVILAGIFLLLSAGAE